MTHLTMVHGTVCHFHDALREPRVLAEFQELALGGLVVPLFLLDLLPFLFLCRVCLLSAVCLRNAAVEWVVL